MNKLIYQKYEKLIKIAIDAKIIEKQRNLEINKMKRIYFLKLLFIISLKI